MTLESCDLRTASLENPIVQPCGDVTTPLGTFIKLGPYGAIMEANVGAGFANTVDERDQSGRQNVACAGYAGLFHSDTELRDKLLDTRGIDFSLYTVYRPVIWPAGKIPVLAWGNAVCAQPEGYGPLLRYIASQGFFVIAANSRFVANDGVELRHALDFARAANDDPASPYRGRLDTTKMGVMGHSQGALGAAEAAADERVSGVILFNGGFSGATSSAKPFLAVSGDMDFTSVALEEISATVTQADKAAFLYFHNPAGTGQYRGHVLPIMTPERLTEASAGFWQLLFNDDAKARALYTGENCGLCGRTADFEFGQNGL